MYLTMLMFTHCHLQHNLPGFFFYSEKNSSIYSFMQEITLHFLLLATTPRRTRLA